MTNISKAMGMKDLETYLWYKKGKLRAQELCAKEVGLPFEEPEDESGHPIRWIQTTLDEEGYHVLKSDIVHFWHLETDLLQGTCRCYDGGPELARWEVESEIKRIPRLLSLHRQFDTLVSASPVHPFELTTEDVLQKLYSGASILVFNGGTPGLVQPERDLDGIYPEVLLGCSAKFIPMPVKIVGKDKGKVDVQIGHWNYCTIRCTIGDDIERLVGAITQGLLPVVWAASGGQDELHLMVRVDASDSNSWVEKGNELVPQLQELGAVSPLFGFGLTFPIPGSGVESELLYFNNHLVVKPEGD